MVSTQIHMAEEELCSLEMTEFGGFTDLQAAFVWHQTNISKLAAQAVTPTHTKVQIHTSRRVKQK